MDNEEEYDDAHFAFLAAQYQVLYQMLRCEVGLS